MTALEEQKDSKKTKRVKSTLKISEHIKTKLHKNLTLRVT